MKQNWHRAAIQMCLEDQHGTLCHLNTSLPIIINLILLKKCLKIYSNSSVTFTVITHKEYHWLSDLKIRKLKPCTLKYAVPVKFQANHWQCWVSKKWGPALRTAGYLIYGIVERWCHLNKRRQRSLACSQKNSISPSAPTPLPFFAFSSLIKWEKSCFSTEQSSFILSPRL